MHILLVDDHAEVAASLSDFLTQLGHSVECTESARAALGLMERARPDLVLTDLRMPDMDGLALLDACEALDQPPPVALMTAFGDQATAIEAMRRGAVDYLRKPVDVRELHRLVERFEPAPSAKRNAVAVDGDALIVLGATMERTVVRADRLHRASDLPCLIQGETGTGKELFARRIHAGGLPSKAPFIAVNTAAIPRELFEAEIFGYEAGAFTGARADGAPGKAELAAGGTLFLDEIGDLPLDQQAKLLRLLEQRTFFRIGGGTELAFTGRIIAATNANLLARVHDGRFREDLYYRLKVGHLHLPPLRERDGTAVALAHRLLERLAHRRGRPSLRLSSDAEAAIAAYAWPGNVREMVHALDQAVLLGDGAVITADQLSLGADEPSSGSTIRAAAGLCLPSRPPPDLRLGTDGFAIDDWHRAIIAAALAANQDSPVKTAEYLGLTRKVLYTLRKRYGLLGSHDEAEE